MIKESVERNEIISRLYVKFSLDSLQFPFIQNNFFKIKF